MLDLKKKRFMTCRFQILVEQWKFWRYNFQCNVLWCRLMGNNLRCHLSFSGNAILSVTSGILGSVSSFSEEYIVYVYFKSYIDMCAASSSKQKIMTKYI